MSGAARIMTAVTAVLAVLTTRCDPILTVRAQVRSIPDVADAAGERAYRERAIAGASVTLDCPGRKPVVLGTTDAAGKLKFATIGLLDRECSVRVVAAGYHPDAIPVRDLCVRREGSSCHFVAVFAELVARVPPDSAPAPSGAGEAPTTEAPRAIVHFTASTPAVSVFVRPAPPSNAGASSLGFGELVAYEAVGAAPVNAELVPGTYRIAAASGEREPVEAADAVEIVPERRIELDYVDRSGLRTLKAASMLVGIVVGPTLIGIGTTRHGVAKGLLIGSGAAVGVVGVAFGADASVTRDALRVRVLPGL